MNQFASLQRPPLRVRQLRAALVAPAGPLARLELLEHCASTNTELVHRAAEQPDQWPELSALTADIQTGGRGRSDRQWISPPRAGVALSILVRPNLPLDCWPQLSLLAGLATVRAMRGAAKVSAGLKWPNDVVLADGDELSGWGRMRKVCGILVDSLPVSAAPPSSVGARSSNRPDAGAVIGIGVNVLETTAELPVPWATSLARAGVEISRHTVICAVVREFAKAYRQWCGQGGFAAMRDELTDLCWSLGRQIRVELPGNTVIDGTADELGENGELVLKTGDGSTRTIVAGDLIHLRDSHHR